ncbi:MAG: 3-hydroxyacyl-ACP dehydratase FabZ family protein [Myxococcota bacterium]
MSPDAVVATTGRAPRVLASPLLVRSSDASSAVVEIDIDANEPLLAGHYPGFPIVPGVCLIECVQRAVELTAPVPLRTMRLSEIESTRFLGAVFPGERLRMELRFDSDAERWLCLARLSTARGQAASVRLRYARREATA